MQYIGKHVLRFAQLDSTNNKAKELLKTRRLEEGTLIIAHAQTSGRGHGQNHWESAPGMNLTASYILRPGFLKAHRQFLLTKVLSLATCDTVTGFFDKNIPVTIKWPNDIYAGDQKIAGILVENTIMGDTIRESIAGIGLNINQEVFISDAPNPVSLRNITGNTIPVDQVCEALSQNIQRWYELLNPDRSHEIDSAYHTRLYRLNLKAAFVINGQKVFGTIRGTHEYGYLILETSTGEIMHLDFKEISFVI